ncbi:MAG TPA: 50S ribosomal protein L17 [Verrucomicrobiae bacterium]|nr:50S ribosomal protein L17 [Verrucomicrobiae bacterium]
MNTSKLGRKSENRDRTLRNIVSSLVLYEKVRTTEAKAKAALPMAERVLNQARSGSIAARRQAKALLFDANAVTKLFEDFSQRWGTRTSGFVRITKLAPRPGDGAAMAQLELLLTPLEEVIAAETKTNVAVRKNKKANTEEA